MRQEDAEELQKKIMSAKFDFNDFLKQTRAVAQMGSMSRVIGMIPGMGKVWLCLSSKDAYLAFHATIERRLMGSQAGYTSTNSRGGEKGEDNGGNN